MLLKVWLLHWLLVLLLNWLRSLDLVGRNLLLLRLLLLFWGIAVLVHFFDFRLEDAHGTADGTSCIRQLLRAEQHDDQQDNDSNFPWSESGHVVYSKFTLNKLVHYW
ncbi:hypothetical protein cgR_1551 [Corynebacterium glutamicum R]|uniref:Secreted protein n=1 Tax=Corynebacterium glutamicum (strain R) TaxID=340322 RepID=A0AB72VAQ3_CORGB|nr:hypothetical protein cgR_1551 [Corynebacterium glutamicum R]